MPIALDADLPYLESAQVVIDGRADEAAWGEALVVDDWVVYFPAPGGEPEVSATARLLCDQQALYLHYQVLDPEPELLRARLTRRDDIWGDDYAGIYLDPAGDAQRGYLFLVNPLGVQADATRMAGLSDEFSWDGQWESHGELTETGYRLEIRIPWRSVRHPAQLDRVGVSLLRGTARSGERSSWPVRYPDISGILVQENLLRGPGRVDQGWGLAVTPSLAFGLTDEGPSGDRWGAWGLAPGLTLRVDPVPALTGLVTVNPDFSQVETDAYQVEVNRRYALYLDEKRPFFMEGREWFEGPYGELVYTRSMTTPRYGARATVEADGWTAAALHVLDGAPADSVSEGGGWGEAELGPQDDRDPTLDTALRLRRAVGPDGHLGLLYSDKTITGSGLANRVAAVDGRLRLADAWELEAALLGSYTSYAEQEEEWSPAGVLAVEHDGHHWVGGGLATYVDQGFRAENGYLPYADSWFNSLWAGYRIFPSRGPVRRVSLSPLDVSAAWNPSDLRLRDFTVEPTVKLFFADASHLKLELLRDQELYQDTMLTYHQVELSWSGYLARWLELGAEVDLGQGPSYDELVVGQLQQLEVELLLLSGRRAALGAEATWERLAWQGEELYSGWVGRALLEYFATPELWARLVLDRDSLDDEYAGQLMLAWEAAPGRAVYLGGGLGQEADQAPAWQLFSKVTWQLQR